MLVSRTIIIILTLLAVFRFGACLAQQAPVPERTLIIGTKEAPPFSMKMGDGSWVGISIDLWRRIAADLNLSYEFRELELAALLQGVENGGLDAAVAALTITPEREEVLDFTHPYFTTGLGIAVPRKPDSPWMTVLKRFLSVEFLKVVAALSLLLLVVGTLVWWFEHKRNPGQFDHGFARGIGSGFWWSAVTMTTVGYGDKAPVTFGGRLVALVWMFAGIIMISGVTAAITSALTLTQLESAVRGPNDLPEVRVGGVAGTTAEAYLTENRLSYRPYKTSTEGLHALASGTIDALVYDAPLLRYLIKQEFIEQLDVLPNTFMRQDYAIALPTRSRLREPINRSLLQEIRTPIWQDTLYRYLGETE